MQHFETCARRTEDLPTGVQELAGFGIKRNPGVICLWMTRSYEVFDDGRGKPLLTVGLPESVTWWCEGRLATRVEVDASITSGLPILLNAARQEGRLAVDALEKQVDAMRYLLPSL